MLLAIATLALAGATASSTAVASDASTFSKIAATLQWLDSSGRLTDVNWHVSARWTWGREDADESPRPTLEVWVQLPEQIHVIETSDPDVMVMEAPNQDDGDTGGQVLVIDTRLPSITARLTADAGNGAEQAGLLLSIDERATRLLVHESCAKYGVGLRQAPAAAAGALLQGTPAVAERAPARPPFYVGITCSRTKKDLTVQVHAPDPASQSTLHIPLNEAAAAKDNGAGRAPRLVHVAAKAGAPATDYEITLKAPVAQARPVEPRAKEKPTHEPLLELMAGIAPSFVTYGAPAGAPSYDPAEYNLELALLLKPARAATKRLSWEAETRLPLLTLLPGPFKVPASGAYSGAVRLQAAALSWGSGPVLRILPGAAAYGFHLRNRSDLSGFYGAPQLTLSLANWGYDIRASAFPLGMRSGQPFFNGYGVVVGSGFELNRGAAAGSHRLELEPRIEYFNLPGSSGKINLTKVAIGLEVWL